MNAMTLGWILASLLLSPLVAAGDIDFGEVRVLDAGFVHLGDDETAEWPEAAVLPDGQRYDLAFDARQNAIEHVLVWRQRNVNNTWTLTLNDIELGTLNPGDALLERWALVPAGVLRDGRNELALVPDVPADDITFGDVRLVERPLRDALALRPVTIRVADRDSGTPLPARITIADEEGELAPLYFAEAATTAVRPGVVYTSQGSARVELPEGSYRVWATRGSEWSLGQASLVVGEAPADAVELRLRREVDTTGFIAADTHIHTLTFSGHGDASVAERMVTLAGEGVELAVATDHNHNTDYTRWQADLALDDRFTSVVGNEVTTPIGHFNAFPLDPEDELPEHESSDWVLVVDDMRAKGARAVILNHPRWPARDTGPFAKTGLDRFTGRRADDVPYGFDAMEVVNATTVEEDPLYLFHDWFALLDRGETIVAVGSSDSHTVGDPVGGGRTYVKSSSDDPAALDVDELADNIAAGRSTVAMGIFTDVTVDGAHGPGDLVPVEGDAVEVSVRIAAPGWVHPRTLRLFVDGVGTEPVDLPATEGQPLDLRLTLELPVAIPHDAWLVAVVTGAPIDGPYWPLLNDYTLGATNPVYLDVDGDGRWSSPRDTAAALLAERGPGLGPPDDVDAAVAMQYLELLEDALVEDAREAARARVAERAANDARVAAWQASRAER